VATIAVSLLDGIAQALVNGQRVELRGFGVFSTKQWPARFGRNPRTGVEVAVFEKSVPYFKTGKEMRKRLNKKSALPATRVSTEESSAAPLTLSPGNPD